MILNPSVWLPTPRILHLALAINKKTTNDLISKVRKCFPTKSKQTHSASTCMLPHLPTGIVNFRSMTIYMLWDFFFIGIFKATHVALFERRKIKYFKEMNGISLFPPVFFSSTLVSTRDTCVCTHTFPSAPQGICTDTQEYFCPQNILQPFC